MTFQIACEKWRLWRNIQSSHAIDLIALRPTNWAATGINPDLDNSYGLKRSTVAANALKKRPILPLVIDFTARAVLVGKRRLALTPVEYRLRILAQHSGKVLTHHF